MLNGYPQRFIKNTMNKLRRQKESMTFQSFVFLASISSVSFKIVRNSIEAIENDLTIQVKTNLIVSSDKYFQIPGVNRVRCKWGLVFIGETGRNLSTRLNEHKP